ncbi:MAG: 50S ribosomal protein L21 [Planctomycetota bacterium]
MPRLFRTPEAMYVVFEDRNQQFRAAPGERLCVPLMRDPKTGDLEPGKKVTFDKVCLITGEKAKIGAPYIKGAKVSATVLGTVRGPKLVVQKLRRRKNSRCRTGFRASFTEIQIDAIDGA